MRKMVLAASLLVCLACVGLTGDTPAIGAMVMVEGGSFAMGDNFNTGGLSEKPVHKVTVSSYYISKYEITQKEWTEIMGYCNSTFPGDDLPVDSASWYEACLYCNLRSLKEGFKPVYTIDRTRRDENNNHSFDTTKWLVEADWAANGYRLPTEAEWEYAARGGKFSKGTLFSGSANPDDAGWYLGNSGGKPHPVGQKPPNELGLYDMSGNVYEICWDWYGPYTGDDQSDPRGPSAGTTFRIAGGSYACTPVCLRVCARRPNINDGGTPRSRQSPYLGLRVVRAAQQ